MNKTEDWSVFRRQPLAAIWLLLLKSLGTIAKSLWPIVLVMLFNTKKQEDNPWDFVLIILPILILLLSLLNYLYFRYSVSTNQLLVKSGVFAKKNIVLPLNRIQAVHIEQNWLHRILSLAEVSFDTPGSDKAEVKINLNKDQAESLKAFINVNNSISQAETHVSEKINIAKLSFSDLFKLGISANHFETLAIMFAVGISFFNNIKQVLEDQYSATYQQSTSDFMNGGYILMVYTAGLILLLSVMVSFIRIVLNYANFSIYRSGSGLSVSGGLINTSERIISYKKIQMVSWRTNWLRKSIPLYLLKYHSIGTKQGNQKLNVKIPVTSNTLLENLVTIYQEVTKYEHTFLRISKSYIYRTTLTQGVLPILLLGSVGIFFFKFNVLVLLIIPVYVYIASRLFHQKFKLYYNSSMLHIRKGIFGYTEIILKWNNIQSVSILQSIYQRQKGLASVKICTAGGTLIIPFITIEEARDIQNYALYKVESSKISWM